MGENVPTISLCMIVRNEADNIRYCLDSVKNVVDEIIIVDTGSTDTTVEICKEYGAQVHHFTWVDDFSAARNESIKYATKDWILVLDGDEFLEKETQKTIKETLLKMDPLRRSFSPYIYQITREQITAEYFDLKALSFNQHTRVFRNHCGLAYKYSLHEIVYNYQEDAIEDSFIVPAIKIMHYGYEFLYQEDTADIQAQKAKRAIACLEKDLQKYPNDLFVRFNLGRSYFLIQKYAEGSTYIEAVLQDYIQHPEYFSLMSLQEMYKMYIQVLISAQEYTRAIKWTYTWLSRLKNKTEIYPYMTLGKLYFNMKQYDQSFKLLTLVESRLEGEKDNKDYHEMNRFTLYMLGAMYWRNGQYTEALKRLRYVRDNYTAEQVVLDLIKNAEECIKS